MKGKSEPSYSVETCSAISVDLKQTSFTRTLNNAVNCSTAYNSLFYFINACVHLNSQVVVYIPVSCNVKIVLTELKAAVKSLIYNIRTAEQGLFFAVGAPGLAGVCQLILPPHAALASGLSHFSLCLLMGNLTNVCFNMCVLIITLVSR